MCKHVKVESGRALDAANGFTVDSLHKQGFTAVFLAIGKLRLIPASVIFAWLFNNNNNNNNMKKIDMAP